MTITAQTTLRELAFIVCTALQAAAATVVLSGGGAATVYAPHAVQSRDLDFIFSFWTSMEVVPSAPLQTLGFAETGGIYRHPENPFTLEFPVGPLEIGNDPIREWDTLAEGDLILHILTPTDSVRDRLASFYFFNDFSALTQALAVAQSQPIDQDAVEKWSRAENELTKFEVFKTRLSHSST